MVYVSHTFVMTSSLLFSKSASRRVQPLAILRVLIYLYEVQILYLVSSVSFVTMRYACSDLTTPFCVSYHFQVTYVKNFGKPNCVHLISTCAGLTHDYRIWIATGNGVLTI